MRQCPLYIQELKKEKVLEGKVHEELEMKMDEGMYQQLN